MTVYLIVTLIALSTGLAVAAGYTFSLYVSPLLIGAKGSPLELTLNSLYFRAEVPDRIDYDQYQRIVDSGLATAVPLYVRFHSQDRPIVGTSLDYFRSRGLRIAQGEQFSMLGDCVIGARVAAQAGLGPGANLRNLTPPGDIFRLHDKLDQLTGLFMADTKPLEELYDTLVDPFEMHNLAADPDYRQTLAKMRGQLTDWMKDTKDHLYNEWIVYYLTDDFERAAEAPGRMNTPW